MTNDTDRQRQAANIELLPTDALTGEAEAFDVLLDGKYIGHWTRGQEGAGKVTWTQSAEPIPTDRVGATHDEIIAAIRAVLPVGLLP